MFLKLNNKFEIEIKQISSCNYEEIEIRVEITFCCHCKIILRDTGVCVLVYE